MTSFHVSPGGSALTFHISPTLRCEKRSVSDYDNNSYLVLPADGDAILVDAPANPQLILDWIGARRVSTVVTTHRHPDHVQALAAAVQASFMQAPAHKKAVASPVTRSPVPPMHSMAATEGASTVAVVLPSVTI